MIKFILIFVFSSINLYANEWKVDCSNYCFFNDLQPNCQGVYYEYVNSSTGKKSRSYSSWNSSQNGCYEKDEYTFQAHLIYPSQINCNCPAPTTTPPSDKSMALTTTTRTKLELLRAQVHAWTPCAPASNVNYPNVFHPFRPNSVNTCQFMRKNLISHSYMTIGGCFAGLFGYYDEEWHGCNFDGDQMANTPSMCLSGNNKLCDEIKDAQDLSTGFWYRNAYMRRHPEVSTFQPSFSRDQMLGMLSYWIKRKDKNAILKWLYAVKSNGKTAPWGGLWLYNLCPPRPNIPKPENLTQAQWDGQLPDDRCGIIPEAWGQIYFAAKWAGLTDAQLNAIDNDMFQNMVSGSLTLDSSIYGEALAVPALGGSAYQLGDTWDAINLRMESSGNNSTIRNAAVVANERTSKLNPLYHWRAEGKATEYGAYLIRKYCTASRPYWGYNFKSGYDNLWGNQTGYWIEGRSYLYSSWQYAGGAGPYGGSYTPNGHDCLTLLNLYLGNANLTELECDNGDALINGACRRYAFATPGLAQIFGIDYKINKSNANIDYMAVDLNTCPYGGTFVSPDPGRCAFASGLTPSQLNGNINYWVDPSQSWPGIYYQKINGACPYGGNASGYNCQIKSYALPALFLGVRYWVDPNPSWPGVYYQKINGACPYGGASSGPNCQIKSFGYGFLDPNKSYFTRSNQSHPGVYYYPRVIAEKHIVVKEGNIVFQD